MPSLKRGVTSGVTERKSKAEKASGQSWRLKKIRVTGRIIPGDIPGRSRPRSRRRYAFRDFSFFSFFSLLNFHFALLVPY